jgi:hypothetical protein
MFCFIYFFFFADFFVACEVDDEVVLAFVVAVALGTGVVVMLSLF